jgi:transcriptional regulator GlxA family with amidase domain
MLVHLALDGVAESALGMGIDLVAAAARIATTTASPTMVRPSLLRQRVVSLDGAPVRSGAGRSVPVDGALAAGRLGADDVVVMAGVSASTESSIDARLRAPETARLASVLAKARARGARIAASCSSTFLLAATGMLDDAPATTNWWLAPHFSRLFPRVRLLVDAMVVDAGHALTAGSALAHGDLMLRLIAGIGGVTLARNVGRYMVVDERTSQTRYMVLEHLRSSDPAVIAAEQYAAKHLHRQISIGELARAGAVSPRTLSRRVQAATGMSPTAMLQRLRVARAAALLETTKLSIEAIAAKVGYSDPAAFRRVFRRHAGQAPGAVRDDERAALHQG